MSKRNAATGYEMSRQVDLFDTELEEGSMDVSLGFRQCLSRAISACGKDRYHVAAEVSRLTRTNFSKDMLDKYTSSDIAYGIRAEVLPAACRVISSFEPFHYLLEPLKAEVVTAGDMKFLRLARLEEQRRQLEAEIMQVRSQCGIK